MKRIFASLGILVVALILFNTGSCAYHSREKPKDLKLKLRWVKAYDSESWAEIRTGLIWALSYLGANVPEGSFDRAVSKSDETHFSFDFSKVGFSAEAQNVLFPILSQLQLSPEMEARGGIDIGRFLMITLHCSWHYYAITGAKPTRQEYENQYFKSEIIEFKLSNSGVALDQRLIRFCRPESYQKLAFIGEEGKGKFENNSFTPTSFETIDLMPNGQLRFGIYDKHGNLETAADSSLTVGGKPGKCQWCHEKTILPLYFPSTDFSNSISRSQFVNYVAQAQQIVDNFRNTLKTDIIYQNAQDHRYAELLYITFLEPSAQRLATDWGISKDSVMTKLAGFQTHTYPEFPFLGELYDFEEIKHLFPYGSLNVPSSARELSAYEPNFVK